MDGLYRYIQQVDANRFSCLYSGAPGISNVARTL